MLPLAPAFCQTTHFAFLRRPAPLPCEPEKCRSRTTSRTTDRDLTREYAWQESAGTYGRGSQKLRSLASAVENPRAIGSRRYRDGWLVRRAAKHRARRPGRGLGGRDASCPTTT